MFKGRKFKLYKVDGTGKCIICGMSKNDNFYDKSKYRPICTSNCYSIYYDTLPNRTEKYDKHYIDNYKITDYQFYKQGHLVLIDYRL